MDTLYFLVSDWLSITNLLTNQIAGFQNRTNRETGGLDVLAHRLFKILIGRCAKLPYNVNVSSRLGHSFPPPFDIGLDLSIKFIISLITCQYWNPTNETIFDLSTPFISEMSTWSDCFSCYCLSEQNSNRSAPDKTYPNGSLQELEWFMSRN